MIEIYDIETFKKCFTYIGLNVLTKEVSTFVLHKDRFELDELMNHLTCVKGQIGFNNLDFDYSIIHFILKNYKTWIANLEDVDMHEEDVINEIYDKAQDIINDQSNIPNTINPHFIKEKDHIIKQLDLYKVWHYNNAARRTSLKALQISMNYPNVMESPIHHNQDTLTLDEVNQILVYNLNDVQATYEFYKLSRAKIDLRKSLRKEYNIPCTNWSDSRIGEQLILKLYSDKINSNPWDIKKLRSNRDKIVLKDCIFNYIDFQSKEFNKLLKKFKSSVLTNTKGEFAESVVYQNFKYDFGSGGIHGCFYPGVYVSDNEYVIKSCDVASLYPNLAIQNKLFPAHLGPEFVEVYQSIISKRIKAKKEGNTVLADGFKLSANSVYGKSNDEYSFLYDPEFTMKITINGQLLLANLAESLTNIPNNQMIMINTDGLEIKIPRIYENYYYKICKDWESLYMLTLEFNDYKKMWISDVNNYGCLDINDKIKSKGKFEVNKMVGSESAYHKDNSFRIIPMTLQEYFINGTDIDEYIRRDHSIYDFCGRQKFKGQDYAITNQLLNNKLITTKMQKNVRYFISEKGSTFIKKYAKGSDEYIHKGKYITIMNHIGITDSKIFDINYKWYISEIQKIINQIEIKQLKLL